MASNQGHPETRVEQSMDQLESSIVHDFQNLQVLNAYSYDKMGDLVRDLTNALDGLDDSVKQKTCPKREEALTKQRHAAAARKIKRKSKKRKSNQLFNQLSDKESSLDEAIKDLIENMTQQSDSDDWIHSGKGAPSLTALSKQVPAVESDSFTENFSPMQPLRHRRRKFKRMAVDPSPDVTSESLLTKAPTVKLKGKVHLASSDNIMDEDRSRSPVTLPSGTSDSGDTLPGKRKRGVRCPGHSFEVDSNGDDCFTKCMDRQVRMEQDQKDSSQSSLSSSECSEVPFTGDEGQEGDDEQSDFFFEPGPACGIPGITPWWEDPSGSAGASGGAGDQADLRLQMLSGGFHNLSQAAQHNVRYRLKQLTKPGREYRSGRRCLKDRRPAYSLSRFLQDRQKWGDACGSSSKKLGGSSSWQCSGSSNGSANNGVDTKRRRKTPPGTPEPGEMLGQAPPPPADCMPDSIRILHDLRLTPSNGTAADAIGSLPPPLGGLFRKNSRKGSVGTTASVPS